MQGNTESKKAARKAALGINWDLGLDGAVVVYMGHEELTIAFLPGGVGLNEKSCTLLAVAFREQGGKIPLTVNRSKQILNKIVELKNASVIVGSQEIDAILKSLKTSGMIGPQKSPKPQKTAPAPRKPRAL